MGIKLCNGIIRRAGTVESSLLHIARRSNMNFSMNSISSSKKGNHPLLPSAMWSTKFINGISPINVTKNLIRGINSLTQPATKTFSSSVASVFFAQLVKSGSLNSNTHPARSFGTAPESGNDKTDDKPPHSAKIVGYHLLLTAALVFTIVIVGGLTRLTESGLSITEW